MSVNSIAMPTHARVLGIEWHNPGVFELQLERNGLRFSCGDCAALYGYDGRTSRPYSFASGEDEDLLRFVIRRMPEGSVSTWLSTRKPGDEVRMSPPFGWFRPGQEGSSFVFVATGTGIAPFLSHFRSRPERPPLQCLYGVRYLHDAVDLDVLQTLCNLRLAVSRESVSPHFHGRVTGLLEDMPVSPDIHYYLCGLDSMIDEVSAWLEGKGVRLTHIHRECFFNASYSAQAEGDGTPGI